MADDREPYGRIVHEQRLAVNAERRKPFGVVSWEERDDEQHELDMRIGSAVAAQAVADAKVRNERLEMQLFAIGSALPDARRALVVAIAGAEYEAEAKPFRRALEIFGGEEGPFVPPDPETPLSDALHTLGQVQREAESMAMSGNLTERDCGRRILAAIGPQGDEEPALPLAADPALPGEVPLPFPEAG